MTDVTAAQELSEKDKPQGVTFVSDYPKLKVTGIGQFVNGRLYLENPEKIKTLRHQIATRPVISRIVREIDLAAAAQIVAAFEQQLLSQSEAVKGGFHAGTAMEMLRRNPEYSKATGIDEAAANNLDPAAGEELADMVGQALTTEDGTDQAVHDTSGFVADPAKEKSAEETAQEAQAAANTSMLNLGE